MAEPKKKHRGLRIAGALLTGGASELTRGTIKGGLKLGKKIHSKLGFDDIENYDEPYGYDQADTRHSELEQKAMMKIVQKAKPKMIDFLEKHGEKNILKENPIHLAMQVANIHEGYEDQFLKKIRGKFLTETEFQRFIKSPDYQKMLAKFQEEQAKLKGFFGFDGEDGSDMQTFLPLVALAPVAAKLGKKAIGGIVKKVGAKALDKAKQKKAAKTTADTLKGEADKKQAQAQAIDAGVPAKVVAASTANLPPEKASEVAKDLQDVYTKADSQAQATSAAMNGGAVENHTLIYIAVGVMVLLLILFLTGVAKGK
jgi:hypothetical protein